MATKDEIYVSVNLNEYKKNKANVLASQVDLINSIKHLRNLKQLLEQEKNFKIRLHEIFSSVMKDLELIEELIPSENLPKSIQEKIYQLPIENRELLIHESASEKKETDFIDKELAEIREKLRQLNSM